MNGRKRHIVVDTMGLVLAILVHPANVADGQGAYATLTKLVGRFPRLRHLRADGAYGGQLPELVEATWVWSVAVVKREPKVKGFVVQPRHWVIEPVALWAALVRQSSGMGCGNSVFGVCRR